MTYPSQWRPSVFVWLIFCIACQHEVALISACSFIVGNFETDPASLESANTLSKLRGPDLTNTFFHDGWFLLHNLLWMTGSLVAQPLVATGADGRVEVAVVFNGEIYNWRSLLPGQNISSDGQVLLPAYKKWGAANMANKLDGEFAIVIVDFLTETVAFLTDPFGTKPIFFAFGTLGRFAVATYRSALTGLGFDASVDIFMADPNTLFVASFDELQHWNWRSMQRNSLQSLRASAWNGHRRNCSVYCDCAVWPFFRQFPLFNWNLTQFKDSTMDWQLAFGTAIAKRTLDLNWQLCTGLSHGYDSGSVHLALALQYVPHHTFTIRGSENVTLIRQRLKLRGSSSTKHFISMDEFEYSRNQVWISQWAEPFTYNEHRFSNYGIVLDQAAVGLVKIFKSCKEQGGKIFMSGAGGDEILSQYKTDPSDMLPDDLSSVFPWPDFYFARQRNFLMKEETIAGALGMETRYPFLDRSVVQEFLWLSPAVKRSLYKRPLHDFMLQHGYPFKRGDKTGFVNVKH
ncbi:asnB [Symbiodinium necroappetens]|uniref:AsnB protein n=1 Tax=Symbiodinium necroappetens TaxID=1628268 RepID=A0A812M776_9DINO|nr:asnB [Symbiodinium necroappetens]